MKENSVKKISFRSLFLGPVPLFVLAHFFHHLLGALPTPLLPMIRSDFALDYTQSGWVISAFSLSYGISQLPGGWLTDLLSPRTLIIASICGVALAGIFVGLSPTYIMLIIFLVLMGLMGGGYHPASAPLISASVEPGNRGQALGLHTIGGGASFFLSPLIAATIAAVWGWRGSFITLAVIAMLFGLVFYTFLGRLTNTSKKAQPTKVSTVSQISETSGRVRRLILVIILSTFVQATTVSSIAFIPLYLVDHFGIGKEAAAALTAAIFSAGLWAGPLGGYISDRLGRVPVILAMSLIAGPIIFLLNVVPYGLGFGVVLILIGITIYGRMPVTEAYIVSYARERRRSSILGIYYFGIQEGAGVLTPILGFLIDRFGFYNSFTIAGVAAFTVSLAGSLWLWGSRD